MRLLFFLGLAMFGLIAARRWTEKLGGKGNPRPRRSNSQRFGRPVAPRPVPRNDESVASVICATCRTEYHPDETAWQCPKCKR